MTVAAKLIPLLLAWGGIVLVLQRRFSWRAEQLVVGCAAGFCAGIAGAAYLLAIHKGDFPYSLIKTVTGCGFVLVFCVSAVALYSATGRGEQSGLLLPKSQSHLVALGTILFSSAIAGMICSIRLSPQSGELSMPVLLLIGIAGLLAAVAATATERLLPAPVSASTGTLLLAVLSLLLFMSASVLRLDLFSPLTMKVMKFIHDFVHQLFETMLFPDHLFARTDVWDYIGFLFSSGVGFWGGLVVWFAPAMLTVLAVQLEPLPSVAHIRQGAKRRKLLAAFIMERRCRLIVPWLAVVVLAAAVYQSRFPAVEYWNPQPVEAAVKPSGEIFVPRKGEIDLEDGRLHKYVSKQGRQEARFMILMGPDGRLTATLDACAICKPQGYGQAEGSVICFYCKTLIPLETVGKPGGCNPVPIPFKVGADGVTIDALTLFNRWSETVTATVKVEGGGR